MADHHRRGIDVVFPLYVAFFGAPDAYVMRGMHLAFALALAFLILPGRDGKAKSPNLFDLALLVAAAAASLYPMFNLEYIRMRMYYVDDPTTLDYVFGITLIVLVMDAARRRERDSR